MRKQADVELSALQLRQYADLVGNVNNMSPAASMQRDSTLLTSQYSTRHIISFSLLQSRN